MVLNDANQDCLIGQLGLRAGPGAERGLDGGLKAARRNPDAVVRALAFGWNSQSLTDG